MSNVNNETGLTRVTTNKPNMDKAYRLPDNYNPSDYPPVKLRNNTADKSETQRKRRSKNRLSNRRSTGYVPKDLVDEAMSMGTNSSEISATNQ